MRLDSDIKRDVEDELSVAGVVGVANDIEVRLPVVDERPDPEIVRDAVSALEYYQLRITATKLRSCSARLQQNHWRSDERLCSPRCARRALICVKLIGLPVH